MGGTGQPEKKKKLCGIYMAIFEFFRAAGAG
jgi:hypothetical protein